MARKKGRRLALIIGISSAIVLISGVSYSKIIDGYKDNDKNMVNKEQITNEKEEKEENKVEEKKYVGTNEEGKKFTYDADEVSEKLNKYDYSNNGEKVVFLTFDDGSSNTVTPKVLDILDENNVKATFFITGKTVENGGENAEKLVKREFDSGHAIANHSYSHDYKYLYPDRSLNLENFKTDFNKTDNILKNILGDNFSTRVLRCPGGYMSWKNMDKLDVYLEKSDKVSIDWNALNADAEGKRKSSQELADYAISSVQNKEMVVLLMHDTYGKEETAKALPQIIKYFKDNGYEFKTLS